MRLGELLDGTGATVSGAARDLDIRGLTADSRQVQPGWLFAALPGARDDGQRYVADAIARGATAVLAGRDTMLSATDPAAALVAADNPRRALALASARFFGAQPRWVAAVTGTNGKSSVVSFTRQIWAALGLPAASLGTLGLVAPGREEALPLTTIDPVELHRRLAQLAAEGVDHLAIEASSHGLDQFRLDGVRVAAAAFTNLTLDHLDYHGTMAAYLDAKRRLFTEVMAPGGTGVLNADTPEFAGLAALCRERRHRILSFGRVGRDIRLDRHRPVEGGQELVIAVHDRRHELLLPVAGAFQAMNVLAALGLVLAGGADEERAIASLSRLQGVRGRIELVARHPNGAPIYVDYAHTPDALDAVLNALRPHCRGALVVVFGCGGDRDRAKRPVMGEIATRLADRAIVTDDNPRSETPAAIRAEILKAAPGAVEIGDRREAIRRAIAGLGPDDLLVVAGKGHELGQIVGSRVLPFDDADEARAAVAAISGANP